MQFSNFTKAESGTQTLFTHKYPLEGIRTLKYYSDDSSGSFSKKEFRWSFNGDYWSSWDTLNQGNISSIDMTGHSYLFLQARYISSGTGKVHTLRINYEGEAQPTRVESTDTYTPAERAVVEYNESNNYIGGPGTIDADTLNGHDGDYYLWRTNHKGTQPISSIEDLAKTLYNLNNGIQNVINGASNVDGNGIGVYDHLANRNLYFKRLNAGTGMGITESNGIITLTSYGGGISQQYVDASLVDRDFIRIPINDSDYTVTDSSMLWLYFTYISDKRTVTLPPSTKEGQVVEVTDESGLVDASARIRVIPYGTDSIDDRLYNIQISPYTRVSYTSNGNGEWFTTHRNQRLSTGTILVPSFIDLNDGSLVIGNDGLYNLFNNANGSGIIRTWEIDTSTTLALQDEAINYIVADYDGGVPYIKSITDVTLINETTIIPLYTIYVDGGTRLHTLRWQEMGLALINKLHQSIVKTQRYRRQSGLNLGEADTRNITISDGIVWVGANRYTLGSINSSTNETHFIYRSGGVWQDPSVATKYVNNMYDDGDLQPLLGSKSYAVNFIYRGIEVEDECYFVLGGGNYTLLEAQGSLQPANLPPIITSHCLLVGRIIVKNGEDTATQIDSMFAEAYQLQSIIEHNDLIGIDGGDASGYFHLTNLEWADRVGKSYVDSSLDVIRATYVPDSSLNPSKFSWANGFLEPSVSSGTGDVTKTYVDASLLARDVSIGDLKLYLDGSLNVKTDFSYDTKQDASILALDVSLRSVIPFFEATCGSTGQYYTLKDAFDAGKKYLKQSGVINETSLNNANGMVIYGDFSTVITLNPHIGGKILFVNCRVDIVGAENVNATYTFERCYVSFNGGYCSQFVKFVDGCHIYFYSGLGIFAATVSDSFIYLNGNNLYANSLVNCTINYTSGNYAILNAFMTNCMSTAPLALYQTSVSNCYCPCTNLTYSIANLKCIGSHVTNVTLNSTGAHIEGNTINGAVTFATGADYNKLMGNKIQKTVTLSAGAEYNTIQGNTITGGLVDNGSTTNIIDSTI